MSLCVGNTTVTMTRHMGTMSPYGLSTHLHRIMDEAQAAISTLCVDLNGLSGALSHLYRAVYRHDSWTCPCSIQPALLELTRSYELSYARIRRHAIEIQVCYNVKHPQQAHRAIEDFLEFQKPPFSPHSSIEMYFGQIQRYLESSPGWILKRARRRWQVTEEAEPRVNFAHRNFDASALMKAPFELRRPNFVDKLKTHHRGVEAYLRKMFTLLQDYRKLLKEYKRRQGVQDLWPDNCEEELIKHAERLNTFVWDELWAKASDVLHQSRFYSGWKPPGGMEPGWGQTIEDVMGPFEHWATPKGHLIEMAAEPKTGAVPRPTSPSITEPMSPPATSSVKAAATPEEQQSSQSHCEV